MPFNVIDVLVLFFFSSSFSAGEIRCLDQEKQCHWDATSLRVDVETRTVETCMSGWAYATAFALRMVMLYEGGSQRRQALAEAYEPIAEYLQLCTPNIGNVCNSNSDMPPFVPTDIQIALDFVQDNRKLFAGTHTTMQFAKQILDDENSCTERVVDLLARRTISVPFFVPQSEYVHARSVQIEVPDHLIYLVLKTPTVMIRLNTAMFGPNWWNKIAFVSCEYGMEDDMDLDPRKSKNICGACGPGDYAEEDWQWVVVTGFNYTIKRKRFTRYKVGYFEVRWANPRYGRAGMSGGRSGEPGRYIKIHFDTKKYDYRSRETNPCGIFPSYAQHLETFKP